MTKPREPKPVDFIGSCKEDLQASPARGEFGHQLWEVQLGGRPPASRPLKTAGPGVRELRVQTADGWFRLAYVTIGSTVYALHAWAKQSNRTAKTDVDLAKRRYSEAVKKSRRSR